MKEISIIEKRQLLIDILNEIDEFCQENNITYFLTYGTLLGAIRHNGFIPWDDDLDICLLRDDYEKLLKEFSSESGYIEIINYLNKKNYIWPHAKIIHNKTISIENNIYKAAIGVHIDMFPLDSISGSFQEAEIHVNKVLRWRNILTIKYLKISKYRVFYKNIAIILSKLLFIIPDRIIIRKIENMSKKFKDCENTDYLCSFFGAYGVREISQFRNFKSVIFHSFEGKDYCIPVGFDDYLSTIYGDYMTLPPKEKRYSTHSLKEYWL